jgi:hypothetical protein
MFPIVGTSRITHGGIYDMFIIRVGGEEAEFLAITLLGRSYPECTDYWDGNWLPAASVDL